MKQCSRCKETKPLEDFNRKTGERLQPYCRACQKVKRREWYLDNTQRERQRNAERRAAQRDINREFVWNYLLAHPCVDCGEGDPIVLEFDHVSGKKEFSVGNAVYRGRSLTSIQEEIGKCVVRCCNCHKRKTAKQFDHWYNNKLP